MRSGWQIGAADDREATGCCARVNGRALDRGGRMTRAEFASAGSGRPPCDNRRGRESGQNARSCFPCNASIGETKVALSDRVRSGADKGSHGRPIQCDPVGERPEYQAAEWMMSRDMGFTMPAAWRMLWLHAPYGCNSMQRFRIGVSRRARGGALAFSHRLVCTGRWVGLAERVSSR